MCRYKRICRPHPSCLAGRCIRGPEKLATFSLYSNVNTIVPDNLNRYDRRQLPPLSLYEMLGIPAMFSLRFNVDTIVLISLNRYDREQLLSRPRARRASWHWMHLHDKPCLLHTALSFWPSDACMDRTQNDNFWKYFSYNNITIKNWCSLKINTGFVNNNLPYSRYMYPLTVTCTTHICVCTIIPAIPLQFILLLTINTGNMLFHLLLLTIRGKKPLSGNFKQMTWFWTKFVTISINVITTSRKKHYCAKPLVHLETISLSVSRCYAALYLVLSI